jgi:eukaryotic-like serine/threonine-protein kinase
MESVHGVVIGFEAVPRGDASTFESPLNFKRSAVFLLKMALLGTGLLAALGLSAFATMRVVLSSQEVMVPSLVAKRVPEAGAVAARRGLALRVEGRRNDAKVPADRIVAQEPLAGSTLKSHRSIRVWLSLGPRRLAVPSVEGQSVRTARITLEQSGAPVGRIVEVDDPAAEGTVLVQRPPAGDADTVGEGVSLLVSRGPGGADYLMPDLIGKKAEDILDSLRLAGLKVAQVRYRSYPGVAAGIVLAQMPAAGHRVSPRTSVSLDISRVVP